MSELDRLSEFPDNLLMRAFDELANIRRFLHNEIDTFLASNNVTLIAIDSLAQLIRPSSFGKAAGGRRRKNCINQLGMRLKRVALKFNVAIVHVNEISGIVKEEKRGRDWSRVFFENTVPSSSGDV